MGDVLRSLRSDGGARPPTTVTALGGLFGRWDDIVGPAVAAHVQPVSLDGDVLVVRVDDPAWATQLKFLERSMRDRLAEVAGVTIGRVEVRVGEAHSDAREGRRSTAGRRPRR